jgi:hypothetical protein
MRPRVRLFASAVLILLINAAPLPAATAESVNLASVDACSLLTQAEMSAATGFPVDSYFYRHDYPGPTNPCTWMRLPPRKADSPPGPTLILLKLWVMSAERSFGGGFGADQDNPEQEITSVSGLGDDAYYATRGLNAGASVTVLNVKKGAIEVQVTWIGTTDHQTVMDAEKTIAAQVLSEL